MVIGCGVCLIVGKCALGPENLHGLFTFTTGVKLKALGYPTPLAGSNDNPNYQTPTNAKVSTTG